MVWGDRTRTIAGLAVVAFTIVGLSACSSAPAKTDGATLTLAQTKSPVQLLRNEAASRLGNIVVGTVNGTKDVSKSCESKVKDPLGLSRAWTSSVNISLAAGSAWRIEEISTSLVDSFADQGWKPDRVTVSGSSYTALTSETSSTTIRVTSTPGDDAVGLPADLIITTEGPCVDTDGEESDEVKGLEALAAKETPTQ
jgi:type IV pilus biogenesis protein CpaD/CtpE